MKGTPTLICISGVSGTGKTRSLKDLNWDETLFLNFEQQPISFSTRKIKYILPQYDKKTDKLKGAVNNWRAILNKETLKLKFPSVNTIVIDSLTAIDKQLQKEGDTEAKLQSNSYAKYSTIAKGLDELIERLNDLHEYNILILAHIEAPKDQTDILSDVTIKDGYSISVSGKNKGIYERNFTYVVNTSKMMDDLTGDLSYCFNLRTQNTSAKIPDDCVNSKIKRIPNNADFLLRLINVFENKKPVEHLSKYFDNPILTSIWQNTFLKEEDLLEEEVLEDGSVKLKIKK